MPKSNSVGESLSDLKQRRGSLQVLNVDLPEEEETAATKRKSDHAKQLRDLSNMTSTICHAHIPVHCARAGSISVPRLQ